MNFKLTRQHNDGLTLTTPTIDTLGIMVVCQQTTTTEHGMVLNKLQEHFNTKATVDIYYQWKTVSIFIFDIHEFDKSSLTNLRNKLDTKLRYAVLLKGEIVKGANLLTDLYINRVSKKIIIGKQFAQLLSIEEGEYDVGEE